VAAAAPLRPVEGVVSDVVSGNTMLVGPKGAEVVEVNAVGSAVWAAIDGQRTIDDLVQVVRQQVAAAADVPVEQLRADVEAFVAELSRLELLQR
jgi:hypothetical protein